MRLIAPILVALAAVVHAQDVVVGTCTPGSSSSNMGRAVSASDIVDSSGALRVASGATGANSEIVSDKMCTCGVCAVHQAVQRGRSHARLERQAWLASHPLDTCTG